MCRHRPIKLRLVRPKVDEMLHFVTCHDGDHGERMFMERVFQFAACLVLTAGSAWAAQQYPVAGMVLNVDPTHKTFVVSCQSIPGYMDAMVMPFAVTLRGLGRRSAGYDSRLHAGSRKAVELR